MMPPHAGGGQSGRDGVARPIHASLPAHQLHIQAVVAVVVQPAPQTNSTRRLRRAPRRRKSQLGTRAHLKLARRPPTRSTSVYASSRGGRHTAATSWSHRSIVLNCRRAESQGAPRRRPARGEHRRAVGGHGFACDCCSNGMRPAFALAQVKAREAIELEAGGSAAYKQHGLRVNTPDGGLQDVCLAVW